MRPLALAGTQISKQSLFRIQYFSITTCQNKIEHSEHIVMKNARNMYSKKTSNSENHTKTVWQLPHTQAAANLAKSKPATLVKHCCPDLEHRTITTPTLYTLHPVHLHHCTPYVVPLCHLHFGTALHRTMAPCHWTTYTVPLYPLLVPLYPLHRTTVPPISYHCTPYIVPSHPIYRTIAPPLS